MARITRRNLVLLLIGLDETGEIGKAELGGITRLQKYIFLLEREHDLKPDGEGFSFTPYKKGPYSAKLYDDLEFLENLQLLESQITSRATEEEADEMEALTFDFLVGNDSEEALAAKEDAYEERKFRLTEKGRQKVDELLDKGEIEPVKEEIRKIKSKFANYSLNDLLYYVYSRHDDMTTLSDIKDKVLRRR